MTSGLMNNIQNKREIYIDNLRLLLIILVVMQHISVTYSGMGSWYYMEGEHSSLPSKIFFLFFNSFNQSYFMGLLFFIAGYFAPGAYDRKGFFKFNKDRFIRLGIPTVFYMLIIHPLIMYTMGVIGLRAKLEFMPYYLNYIVTLNFIGGSGPLWFAFALLIFSMIYAVVRLVVVSNTKSVSRIPIKTSYIMFLIGLIALGAFIIRLIQPMGTSVLNMQFCYFSQYVILFIIGTVAYRNRWFSNLKYRYGVKWLKAVLLLGPILWSVLVVAGGALKLQSTELYNGGLHWQAVAYAFLESFIGVAMSIGLIALFKEKCNKQNNVLKVLSDNSFAVYIFHAPIIITMAIVLRSLILPPIIKFFILCVIAMPVCFGVTNYILKRVPLLNKMI
ncbi:Glucans biosynthesis protein C [Sporomusa silvacetica DSM 10669]|uniref:Glucans biosynthesis protein C n=1 Tax=Sporomusa silvacetica DSM 10669 TaxID=1123289 RepID=A0ABZ3IU84_9FIRM|nr:acyltransferase family protein [Sporomusa silvacetica]OZC21101.1 glucans biosynthesis protein C [Sporomusa silvacetica DSM 10669]